MFCLSYRHAIHEMFMCVLRCYQIRYIPKINGGNFLVLVPFLCQLWVLTWNEPQYVGSCFPRPQRVILLLIIGVWWCPGKKRPQDSLNWENCRWTNIFPRKYCSKVIFGTSRLFWNFICLEEAELREILVGFFGTNFGRRREERYNAFKNFPYFQSGRVVSPTNCLKSENERNKSG